MIEFDLEGTVLSANDNFLSIFGYPLELVRVDGLSRIWGTVFHIAAFLAALYSLHVEDDTQHVAALVYAGAAIGAVFAGDLITLFVYWELTAISSVFLVWARAGARPPEVTVDAGRAEPGPTKAKRVARLFDASVA